jgi:hypothetical protein
MFLDDSVDMRVYQVLRERCGLFEHFVGYMQPVLALARDALRQARVEGLLQEIEQNVAALASDVLIANAFSADSAKQPITVAPPVTRDDLAAAVAMLEQTTLPVKAKKLKGGSSWRITGATPKAVEVGGDREALERSVTLLPLSLGSALVRQIDEKIPTPTNRVPLVVAEYSDGAYTAKEVRWVDSTASHTVQTAAALRQLLAQWDGTPPPTASILRAQEQARAAAKKRVLAIITEDRQQEQHGVANQLEAARLRLLRELGRTLRCLGTGDLGTLFQGQLNRDTRAEGRYRKAFQLLGGITTWPSDELAAIEAHVNALKPSQRQARITGTEIDAALNDPRWRILHSS